MLALAVIPPLYIIYKVYKLDKIEKEPRSLLIKLFFFGILALIPTLILEIAAENYIVKGVLQGIDPVFVSLIENFLCVALIEEGCKYWFLKRGSWHDVNFDYCFDAIVYSVVVSLGFAAVENIFYVFDYGAHVALIRAVTAIPGHAIFGIFMGHYYGQAKMQEKIETYYKMIGMPANTGNRESSKSLLKKSLFIPVMLHGFYDFTASQNEPVMTIVFYIFIIIMDVVAVKRINRYSREDRPI